MSGFLGQQIEKDDIFRSVSGTFCTGIPQTTDINTESARAKNCLIRDSTTDLVFISNGMEWIEIGATTLVLPSILQGIADLAPLAADNIIYTQAVDDFVPSPITSAGRTFLTQPSIPTQQAILDLIPGTDIQIQNPTLQGVADLNPVVGDRMLYTSSTNNFLTSAVDTFGLSLLDTATAGGARTTLDVVQRAPSSAINEIALHDGNDGLLNTGVTIIGDSIGGALINVTATGSLSSTSIDTTSIANSGGDLTVEGTSISVPQWSFLSVMQDVSTAATPTFTGLSANSQLITSVLAPSSATDAANKSYVDNSVAGLQNPFGAAQTATTGQLNLTGGGEAGAGVGKTISGTVANIGTIDGVVLALTDEVLVKNGTSITPGAGNPNNSSSNGIYIVTDDGASPGPLVVLTRSTDADQPAEFSTGRSVFIDTGPAVNGGTTWQLTSATPTTVDTDPIQFSQTGAAQNLTEGNGIDIIGSVISVDANATSFAFPGGELDIVAGGLPISKGGTSTTSFAAGDRLIATNVGNTALTATTLDPSTITTDSNIQTFTNKTYVPDTGGNVLTLDGINFSNAGSTTAGNLLTVVGGTAQWAAPPSATIAYERQVTVAQSGGDYTSIQAALVDINAGTITGGVPAATNWVIISVYPGLYTEVNPIVVPQYVTVRGIGYNNSSIVTGTSAVNDIFQMGTSCSIVNIEARGNTTGDGFNVSYAPTTDPVAQIDNCIARNCGRGFHAQGTGVINSSVTVIKRCNAIVTGAATQVMTEGFLSSAGARLLSETTIITGFFGAPSNITYGHRSTGADSLSLVVDAVTTLTTNGLCVDGGAEIRSSGINIATFTTTGLIIGPGGSIGRFSNVYIQDDTAIFPNQIHILAQSGAALLQGMGIILRSDLTSLDPSVSVEGLALSTTPGESRNQFLGELAVGFPNRGFETTLGEGDSHTFGMSVFTFDASGPGFSLNLADDLKVLNDGNTVTIFPSNTVGDILYIGGDVNLGVFPGIKSTSTTAVVPAGGRLNGTVEPPIYHYVWEYWDGSGWVEFRIMTTDAESPYNPHRRDSFYLGGCQNRFGQIVNTRSAIPSTSTFISANTLAQRWVTSGTPSGNWTQNTVNGVLAFWMRIRLISPLTVVPVLDQIKLHTNRHEINKDGYNEYFGKARSIKKFIHSFKEFTDSPSVSPANTDIYLSDNVDLDMLDNRFNNGATDRISHSFVLPAEVDTSHGMIVQWKWAPTNTSVGNIQWVVRWGYTQDFAVNTTVVSSAFMSSFLAPTEGLTEQRITFTTPGLGTSQKQVNCFCRMDVSDMVSNRSLEGDGDEFWISITREGNAGADTFTGNAYMLRISVMGYAWNNGQAAL